MFRRSFVFGIGAALAAALAACTNNALDPAKIADLIKVACGILVPAATIASIISAQVGATAEIIVSLVCTSYTNAMAAKQQGAALKSGETVDFVVVVNGKQIPVHATVQ